MQTAVAEPVPFAKQCKKSGACVCKDLGGDMEIGFTTRCTFKNSDVEKAYTFFRLHDQEGKYLAASMPRRNTKQNFETEQLSVEYQWQGKQKLLVMLHYAGGENAHTFTQQGKDTRLNLFYSPD